MRNIAIRNLLWRASEKQIIRRMLRLTLRAIGCVDVCSGILPPQSGFRLCASRTSRPE